jgi:hypothetical protein
MLSWRYDLSIWNAPKDIANACMATEGPVFTGGAFKYASRTVSYARGGASNSKLVQTNRGNSFINSAPIPALFERNNITLQTADGPVPYSSKVYAHRVLPEILAGQTQLLNLQLMVRQKQFLSLQTILGLQRSKTTSELCLSK